MSLTPSEGEHLRQTALVALGPLGDSLAREVLERGVLSIEHDVKVWEGTQGPVHGHRVIVVVEAELGARLAGAHATIDGLNAALASAMSERRGHAVADLRLETGNVGQASSPYRDR